MTKNATREDTRTRMSRVDISKTIDRLAQDLKEVVPRSTGRSAGKWMVYYIVAVL
jgi:hypothetical protein